jgi:drug/metabolite transporter (DMT)-like permease
MKKVPSSEAGVILLLEPVSGALLAAFFLHQPLTLNILLGGGLILFSNYLVVYKD